MDALFDNKKKKDELSLQFIQRLHEARTSKNLSQEKIAELMKISVPAYRKYETGSGRKDTPLLLHELSRQLDVSADYLLGLSYDKRPENIDIGRKTGLSDDALNNIINLYKIDTQETDAVHFLNCFLGADNCERFFVHLASLARSLFMSTDGNHPSPSIINTITSEMSNYILDYLKNHVIFEYGKDYFKDLIPKDTDQNLSIPLNDISVIVTECSVTSINQS